MFYRFAYKTWMKLLTHKYILCRFESLKTGFNPCDNKPCFFNNFLSISNTTAIVNKGYSNLIKANRFTSALILCLSSSKILVIRCLPLCISDTVYSSIGRIYKLSFTLISIFALRAISGAYRLLHNGKSFNDPPIVIRLRSGVAAAEESDLASRESFYACVHNEQSLRKLWLNR